MVLDGALGDEEPSGDQEYRNTTTTRRGLLGVATVGLGAAIGGVLTTPVAAYLLASVTQEATFHPVSLGPARSFSSETGFAPTAAPYVEDPAQPLSRGLAYVHYTGGSDRNWARLTRHVRGCPITVSANANTAGITIAARAAVFSAAMSTTLAIIVTPLGATWPLGSNRCDAPPRPTVRAESRS